MPTVSSKLKDIVQVKAERGDIIRIDHSVNQLGHLDYSELPEELEPYHIRYLNNQKEKRFSIIAGLVMEIENINDKLQEKKTEKDFTSKTQ